MPRLARAVIPGRPHHVTQRGNRRQQTFFGENDYRAYLSLLGQWCATHELRVWAYCLMPNHVHLIVVPRRQAVPPGVAERDDEEARRGEGGLLASPRGP